MGDFYYGDNLDVLRGRAIKDESVDLVYLDPPFNSQRAYNVIHREHDGSQSEAQNRARIFATLRQRAVKLASNGKVQAQRPSKTAVQTSMR